MKTKQKLSTTLTINVRDRTRFKAIRDGYSEELSKHIKVVPDFSIASFFDLILKFVESNKKEFLEYCFKDRKV